MGDFFFCQIITAHIKNTSCSKAQEITKIPLFLINIQKINRLYYNLKQK